MFFAIFIYVDYTFSLTESLHILLSLEEIGLKTSLELNLVVLFVKFIKERLIKFFMRRRDRCTSCMCVFIKNNLRVSHLLQERKEQIR